jgi:hypothetical protein
LITYDINFVYVNIFNLLIKTYLSLILIKYLINESIVKIKLLRQKCSIHKITKLL